MTYAIVICRKCKRRRMIDRSSSTSNCPYCGAHAEHKDLRIIFENRDQNTVRNVLMKATQSNAPEKKRPAADSDPLSTLIYKYENCTDPQKKMELLSAGLTDIYGSFSLEDIEKVDEKNAERLLSTMLELCYVHEVKYGRYCA